MPRTEMHLHLFGKSSFYPLSPIPRFRKILFSSLVSDHSKYSPISKEPFKGQQDACGTAVQLAAVLLESDASSSVWFSILCTTQLHCCSQHKLCSTKTSSKGKWIGHITWHLLISLNGREAAKSTHLDTRETAKKLNTYQGVGSMLTWIWRYLILATYFNSQMNN